MNEIFPIHTYPVKQYQQTQDAFRRLLARPELADVQPTVILETFAGLGGQTVSLQERFGKVPHWAYEKDETCFKELLEKATMLGDHVDVRHQECPMNMQGEPGTLLVVDGAYTAKQHEDYTPYFYPQASWLILCEQARRRLHLHYKSYDVPTGCSYEEYLQHVAARIGRPLVAFETTSYSPSYVLFGAAK